MALSEQESVVRKSRFSEENMVQILREADRTPIGEVAKQHGISEQTIYNWRRHFGSMDSADVKRLREIEQENARLKKMVADRDSEIDVMKEIAAKNGERAGSTRAGPVCGIPGAVAAKGVRAAVGGKVDHELHVEDAGEKCSSAGCYGVTVVDVSTGSANGGRLSS
jgi:putative transposase